MTYIIEISPDARKIYEKLAQKDTKNYEIIKAHLKRLAENPRLGKPLVKNFKGKWSLRAADYRIIYEINDKKITILILDIGHRRNVYDD